MIRTLADLSDAIADAQLQRAALGKPPLDICVPPFEDVSDAGVYHVGAVGSSVARLEGRIDAYADAGVTWLIVELPGRTFVGLRGELTAFAGSVLEPSRRPG